MSKIAIFVMFDFSIAFGDGMCSPKSLWTLFDVFQCFWGTTYQRGTQRVPTKSLEYRYKWEYFPYHDVNPQNRYFWHTVDSKPKGYFGGVCVVNMSLKIKTFDHYLDFGRKDLPENALKRLYEKLIFCDFAHFYLIFPYILL